MANDEFDYDFDFDAYEDIDRDAIEGIHLYFDADGAADLYMDVDGELIDLGTLAPDEVSDLIWEDLYWWADEEGIPFEVEEEY